MAVNDRWHKVRPRPDEPRCEHGHVATPQHGAKKRWQVRYRDEFSIQRKASFDKKADADRFDASQRADVARGSSVDVHAAAKQTVSQYIEHWLSVQLWRDGSLANARSMMRNHVEPTIGHLPVGAIRASHVKEVLNIASEKLGESSLSQLRTYLAMMFAAAVNDRLLSKSPVDGVKVPSPSRAVTEIPDVDQVHAVAAALPERFRAVAWLAAGCGLRIGEILGLEVEDVFLVGDDGTLKPKGTVTVRQQLAQPSKGQSYLGPAKTRTSVRTVEVPAIVADALTALAQAHPPVKVDVEDKTEKHRPGTRQARLLFAEANGRPVRRQAWSDVWCKARTTARFAEGYKRRGVHMLRHFYASALIHAGASAPQVQEALGHATVEETLKTYTHLFPDTDKRPAAIMDAALGTSAQTHVPQKRPEKITEPRLRSVQR